MTLTTGATESAELRWFLGALVDDVARLAFADWFDERFAPTRVRRCELPRGLRKWWLASGHHRLDRWEPFESSNRSSVEIWYALRGWRPGGVNWLDRGGASVVVNHPVLVGEPHASRGGCLRAAAEVQRVLKCPVSWSPRSYSNDGACTRLVVWFTFPAPVKPGGWIGF